MDFTDAYVQTAAFFGVGGEGGAYFALVAAKVGGYVRPGEATNSLLILVVEGRDQKWLSHFPAMPTKLQLCAVATSSSSLGCNKLDTVEVLDTDFLQWSITIITAI